MRFASLACTASLIASASAATPEARARAARHDPAPPSATDEPPAAAPSPSPPEGPPKPAATLPPADAAPVLKTFVEPAYPPEARRQNAGGVVTLKLQIDERGAVTDATIVRGLGAALDEAARAAARRLEFHPARQGGQAVAASLRFEFRFTPPHHTHTGLTESPKGSDAAEAVQLEGIEEVTVVHAVDDERPLTAASARSVRERDLKLRPILRPGDLFRVTPGLMVVQHAGGGKANQYLLRGFDADHGTDVALSLDGVPLNMVSHGHGQGYADANWIIPELVERVDLSKGPYFPELGDFSSAGAIDLVTRDRGESFVSVGGGSFDTVRGVAIASPASAGALRPLLAAELVLTDGPFKNPERFKKLNLYGKLTYDVGPSSRLAFTASAYNGSWNASGQLPSRAVRSGLVDFFGALDPHEGGASARRNLSVTYRLRPDDRSELRALAYLSFYDFTLHSNFTFFSRDPVAGDAIEQRDSRTVRGARASYRWLRTLGPVVFDSSLGGDARADTVDNGLSHTQARERLASVVDARIDQSSIGLWAKEEVQLLSWLRLVGGLRFDHFTFRVDDRLESSATRGDRTSGSRGAARTSPKASLVISPHRSVDLFANFGYGFHSNDARGVVRARDGVTPLTRTVGYEVGTRARLFGRRLELAAALWGLDINSEIVWVGDEGTTEASGATRRVGVELEARAELLPWLFADLDATASEAKFRQNAGNGRAVALAPRLTLQTGLSAQHRSGLRGGLRGLHIAKRPATEDEFLAVEATTLIDLFAAYRWRSLEVALTVENALNRRYKSAQFATVTRLSGEPPPNAPPPAGACPAGTRAAADEGSGAFLGCEDVSFSPGNPLGARLMATYHF